MLSAPPLARKVLWLTWEKQIRNRSLSAALGAQLAEIISRRRRVLRYAICISRTLSVLWREGPPVVVCQNPSVVLTLLLLAFRPMLGFKLVIDAHFGGVEAYNGSAAFQHLLDYCNRKANLVIVTNPHHAQLVCKAGGRGFVCPDPLPDLSQYREDDEVARKVFLICSFDIDEPYREVFRAAEILNAEGFRFFVSGNYRKARIAPRDFPHVHLLGFVSESEFYRHLFSSQVVVDLTDHDNCLPCGAYEALEAGKPLVLSKKVALQDYFTGGTVFTENRGEAIAFAVRLAHSEGSRLKEDCRRWVSQARADMKLRAAALSTVLEQL